MDSRNYNRLWEKAVGAINEYEEDGMDNFFRFYLKAKYSNTRTEGQTFDGDYHRAIFTRPYDKKIGLAHNQAGVIQFLDGPFKYYAALYEKFLESYNEDQESAYAYNRVNDLDGAFLLLLSSCAIEDLEENEKVEMIPYELDRIFSLLQLQNAYDSNTFQEMLFRISADIREKPKENIRPVFDLHLQDEISKRRMTQINEPLKYTFFKQTGINLNARFKRYFFSRVDQFLASNLNLGVKHSIPDLTRKTGVKTGFHIEHILAHNDENLLLFGGDEERFEQERNRLGAILLLKGKDNISSKNEVYAEKLKTYANTLYWNETLRKDSYKSKLDMTQLNDKYDLNLASMDIFGPDELEERQQILFKIISIIWK